MSKKNPNLIKIGDIVKITNPFVFVRCGYPLTVSDMEAEIEDYEEEAIMKLIDADSRNSMSYFQEKAFYKMKEGLMLYLLARRGFGGKERTVHTSEERHLLNQDGRVISTKRVVTGTYNHASGFNEDYEPAYLTEMKHHRILELKLIPDGLTTWVPEINVTKL